MSNLIKTNILQLNKTLGTAFINNRRNMTAFSHMSDNDPKVLEKEKRKSLNKADKDKEWNEKLASHSEAAVKADKEKEKSVDQLQSETVNQLEKEKHEK